VVATELPSLETLNEADRRVFRYIQLQEEYIKDEQRYELPNSVMVAVWSTLD
jgi:hypothetical protein